MLTLKSPPRQAGFFVFPSLFSLAIGWGMENISRIFLSISLFILLSFTKTFAEADLFLTPLLLYFNMLNNMTAKGGIPMKQKKYGLPTAITMIVGIVIGSGIFFKSDNILVYTGGNVAIGILVFSLAAISIIFGGPSSSARTAPPAVLAGSSCFCTALPWSV